MASAPLPYAESEGARPPSLLSKIVSLVFIGVLIVLFVRNPRWFLLLFFLLVSGGRSGGSSWGGGGGFGGGRGGGFGGGGASGSW